MTDQEAWQEAYARYDGDRRISDDTGEEETFDDWGYAESERRAFLAGVEWQKSRHMTPDEALKVVTIDSVAQTTGLSHAQVANILELIGDKPEWEEMTERRITYGYGVNSDQRYSGFYGSFEQMREHVEQVTQGGVDVTRREQRTVAYGPWEPVQ